MAREDLMDSLQQLRLDVEKHFDMSDTAHLESEQHIYTTALERMRREADANPDTWEQTTEIRDYMFVEAQAKRIVALEQTIRNYVDEAPPPEEIVAPVMAAPVLQLSKRASTGKWKSFKRWVGKKFSKTFKINHDMNHIQTPSRAAEAPMPDPATLTEERRRVLRNDGARNDSNVFGDYAAPVFAPMRQEVEDVRTELDAKQFDYDEANKEPIVVKVGVGTIKVNPQITEMAKVFIDRSMAYLESPAVQETIRTFFSCSGTYVANNLFDTGLEMTREQVQRFLMRDLATQGFLPNLFERSFAQANIGTQKLDFFINVNKMLGKFAIIFNMSDAERQTLPAELAPLIPYLDAYGRKIMEISNTTVDGVMPELQRMYDEKVAEREAAAAAEIERIRQAEARNTSIIDGFKVASKTTDDAAQAPNPKPFLQEHIEVIRRESARRSGTDAARELTARGALASASMYAEIVELTAEMDAEEFDYEVGRKDEITSKVGSGNMAYNPAMSELISKCFERGLTHLETPALKQYVGEFFNCVGEGVIALMIEKNITFNKEEVQRFALQEIATRSLNPMGGILFKLDLLAKDPRTQFLKQASISGGKLAVLYNMTAEQRATAPDAIKDLFASVDAYSQKIIEIGDNNITTRMPELQAIYDRLIAEKQAKDAAKAAAAAGGQA